MPKCPGNRTHVQSYEKKKLNYTIQKNLPGCPTGGPVTQGNALPAHPAGGVRHAPRAAQVS